MTTTERPVREFRVVGTRPLRHDGVDKVLGRALYGADVKMPGLVHGAVLRSPHAHARIRRVDASEAARAAGVLAVITGEDMPVSASKVMDLGEEVTDAKWASQRIMAHDKAIYRGHPVAAVAAVDLNTALEALKLIAVDYEVLTPVISLEDAMAPDAVVIHEDLVGTHLGEKVAHTNVAEHTRTEFGDPEAAFAQCAHVPRTNLHHLARAPGLHRTAQRDGVLGPGRQAHRLDEHPVAVRRAQQPRDDPQAARLRHQGRAHGDRRGVRREDPALPRTARGRALEEERQTGQARDGPQVGLRRDRARSRWTGHRQDGRGPRGEDPRRHRGHPVHGGGLSRGVHRRRDRRRVRVLPGPERAHRRLRRGDEHVEDRGLPRARDAAGGVRQRIARGRTVRDDRAWIRWRSAC